MKTTTKSKKTVAMDGFEWMTEADKKYWEEMGENEKRVEGKGRGK